MLASYVGNNRGSLTTWQQFYWHSSHQEGGSVFPPLESGWVCDCFDRQSTGSNSRWPLRLCHKRPCNFLFTYLWLVLRALNYHRVWLRITPRPPRWRGHMEALWSPAPAELVLLPPRLKPDMWFKKHTESRLSCPCSSSHTFGVTSQPLESSKLRP